MDKILQINYQNRTLQIEESAYQAFQTYESELKTFFLKEEEGAETFADLQNRMAEILEQKNALSTIVMKDIDELIATIGRPADFDENYTAETTQEKKAPVEEKRKLFRNKKDKVIAGVCSGIANYFAIDPIAVRLIFALFSICTIITLFEFPIGIVAYILFWIFLKPKQLEINVTQKLFRNPKDKVLGGVCSGLAHFFNTETWLVRLLFAAPFIIEVLTNHNNIFVHHNIISTSIYSFTFICYATLWFIVPLAKSPTDYMLLKREPINIATIQNSTAMSKVLQTSKSGLNAFLKVVAYIILATIVILAIPTLFGILTACFFSYNVLDIILFSTFNKVLGILSICCFIGLPVLGLIIWGIRKIGGYKSPHIGLRIAFSTAWILGFISIFILGFNLMKEMNTYANVVERMPVNMTSDTLFIQSFNPNLEINENVVFNWNPMNHLMERKEKTNEIHAVQLSYEQSEDSVFVVKIEKSAFANDKMNANQLATSLGYEIRLDGNQLKLASAVSVPNNIPYHFQHVKVTVFVPKNKTLVIAKNLKKELNTSIHIDNHNFNINVDDDDKDEIYFSNTSVISHNDRKMEQKDQIESATEVLQEVKKSNEEDIKEAEKNLAETKRKAELELKNAAEDLKRVLKDTIK